MARVPAPRRVGAGGRPRAGGDRLLEVVRHRGRAAKHRRQALLNSISLKEARRVPLARQAGPPLRRGRHRHGLRRERAGGHCRTEARDLPARLQAPDRAGRLPARRDRLDPNVFAIGTGIEEHAAYALDFIEAVRRSRPSCRNARQRRHQQRLVRLPRQRHRPRGDPRRLPVPRRGRRSGHGHRQSRRPGRVQRDPRRACASVSRTWSATAGRTPPTGCSRSPRCTRVGPNAARPTPPGVPCRLPSG